MRTFGITLNGKEYIVNVREITEIESDTSTENTESVDYTVNSSPEDTTNDASGEGIEYVEGDYKYATPEIVAPETEETIVEETTNESGEGEEIVEENIVEEETVEEENITEEEVTEPEVTETEEPEKTE